MQDISVMPTNHNLTGNFFENDKLHAFFLAYFLKITCKNGNTRKIYIRLSILEKI